MDYPFPAVSAAFWEGSDPPPKKRLTARWPARSSAQPRPVLGDITNRSHHDAAAPHAGAPRPLGNATPRPHGVVPEGDLSDAGAGPGCVLQDVVEEQDEDLQVPSDASNAGEQEDEGEDVQSWVDAMALDLGLVGPDEQEEGQDQDIADPDIDNPSELIGDIGHEGVGSNVAQQPPIPRCLPELYCFIINVRVVDVLMHLQTKQSMSGLLRPSGCMEASGKHGRSSPTSRPWMAPNTWASSNLITQGIR